jgi:hypothetical protein
MLPIVYKPKTTLMKMVDSFQTWSQIKIRTTQKAPHNLPLPYTLEEGVAVSGGSIFTGFLGSPRYNASDIAAYCRLRGVALMPQAANISYERFRDATATNAALGVDFVEYRQSLDMIVKRAGQLMDFSRKLRKFDFVGAARVLAEAKPALMRVQKFGRHVDVTAIPRGVSVHKRFANNFLEYHFGWEPLVKDVYDSMEILHNPVKKFASLKGTGATSETVRYNDNLGSVTQRGVTQLNIHHKQGGFVAAVSNGTLHSLEQYGLLNPLTLAWEVIPFSFVVDWFADVGNVLRSYSDFAGMTLSNVYSVSIARASDAGVVVLNPGYARQGQADRVYSSNGVYVVRSLGLTGPVFSVKKLRLPSVTRAATSISLLIQFLRK